MNSGGHVKISWLIYTFSALFVEFSGNVKVEKERKEVKVILLKSNYLKEIVIKCEEAEDAKR